jgi:tetratricopeptide (TPR) repeat protein
LGAAFYYARQYDQAIELERKTLELDSNFVQAHSNLGAAYVQKSMFKEALAEFEKALVTSPGSTVGLSGLGYAYAVTGRRDEAKKVLDQLNQFSKQKYVPATELVRIYAGLGEKDKAFEWLKKGYEERSIAVNADIPLDPAYDPLRSDPRFAHLLRRMNLQPCRHENICAIVADFQR